MINNKQSKLLGEDAQFMDAKYEASEFKDLSNLKVWLTGALHNSCELTQSTNNNKRMANISS